MNIEVKNINRNEVLKYLNYQGSEIPPEIDALIDASLDEVSEKSTAKYTYSVFELEGTALKGTNFTLPGEDIKVLLKDCKSVILMGATLGLSIDRLIHMTEFRDLSKSIVLDSCASAAIEAVCNEINKDLIVEYRKKGFYLTDRFSPGYGDMPLSFQRDFSKILNLSKNIGVNLSSTDLMIPRKSVTAIIGIADKPQKKRSAGCENCRMFKDCIYRKAGEHCGN
ncbi:methionine synthase [Gallicola sp. Sow4_E12]|uniref:methionine synthase n=1 Tax=Gallicola sp. Sow4_E12 TaxID=3438785 RepID=UPI003F8E154E